MAQAKAPSSQGSDMADELVALEPVNQRLHLAHALVNDESPIEYTGEWFVGIDLGTADIQTLVVDGQGTPLACFLDWADVVKDGVVVDYMGACRIVGEQVAKVEQKMGQPVTHAVTSFPPGTDPRISTNVVESCGLEIVAVVDEPSSVAQLLNIQNGAVVDVGGGTTGTAIIRDGEVVGSLDDPTGGRHLTLTISGSRDISYDEAESFKRDETTARDVLPIVRPVIEKMTDLVRSHVEGHCVDTLYLTGGSCALPGFKQVFEQEFPQMRVVLPDFPIYLTPLAIASYSLSAIDPLLAPVQSSTEGHYVNH